MHDKNGVEIKVGSFVKARTYVNGEQAFVVAKVIATKPGAKSCNVYIAVPYTSVVIREEYANAGDVEVVPECGEEIDSEKLKALTARLSDARHDLSTATKDARK
jgi:hypothetical protein